MEEATEGGGPRFYSLELKLSLVNESLGSRGAKREHICEGPRQQQHA